MAKTNAVARVQTAKTNPFKKDKTLADMKRTWRGMTPAQRKDNAELFSKVAKGKPKGSAPKPAATKPAATKPAKKPPVAKTQAAKKPPVVKTTPATTTKSGQGPRAGSRANPGSGSKETTTAKPARTRAQNRRSSSTAQSRATAARRRGLANNRRQAEQAARKRASKNSVFRSSYRRASDAKKKK